MFQYGRRISPDRMSFPSLQRCRYSVYCRRRTLQGGWALHQRLIIICFSRNGSVIWTNRRRKRKSYMFRRARRPLTRLWLVRKAPQIQHNVSHCGTFDCRRVQAKSWTCNLSSFRIQISSVMPRFCICGKEYRTGTSLVSSTPTLLKHGGFLSENE